VSRHAKLLLVLLDGASDQTIRFDGLCALLTRLGFTERRGGGSHRIFSHGRIPEILNLQRRTDRTAKPYQVRQIRAIILRYNLAVRADFEAADER
jgi:predicted RNA binding protein YcfA (HicA-like mRNA interferase family)